MTNEQKLEAVMRGQVGSYNLAPTNGTGLEVRTFQPLARTAHAIAMERGYGKENCDVLSTNNAS